MKIISVGAAEAVVLADDDFEIKSAEAIMQVNASNDDVKKTFKSKSPSPSRFNKNFTIGSAPSNKKTNRNSNMSPSRNSPLK